MSLETVRPFPYSIDLTALVRKYLDQHNNLFGKRMKTKITAVIGLLLCILSGFEIYKFAAERIESNRAYSAYSFPEVFYSTDKLPIIWKGNEIQISDSAKIEDTKYSDEVFGELEIKINQESHTHADPIRIRANRDSLGRYHGSAKIAVLRNEQDRKDRLGIIQVLGGENLERDFQARLLLVEEDGTIESEIFSRSESRDPPYRLMFMRLATMTSEGFKYDVYNVYPSLFYPVLFPFVSMGLGILLLLIALIAKIVTIKTEQGSGGNGYRRPTL